MSDLAYELNRIAGTVGKDAVVAANRWAGTKNLDLVQALNRRRITFFGFGTQFSYTNDLPLVLSQIAGISGLTTVVDATQAASKIAPSLSVYPTDFSDCVGWWDGADYTMFSTPSSEPTHISAWTNRGALVGGAALNMTNGTDAQRPLVGTRSVNGLNVVDYDGSAQRHQSSSITLAQPWTAYIVIKSDDGANDTAQTCLSAVTSSINFGKLAANTWSLNCGTALSGGAADTNTNCFTLVANGGSSIIRQNGTQIAAGNAGSNGFSNEGLRLGCKSGTVGNFYDGIVGEVILFSSAHSSTQWNQFESALKAKWGI